MRTIMTTVGTSLLNNGRKAGLDKPSSQDLLRYLRETTATRASAETNSLDKLLKPGDNILFLHSHTDDGLLCANILAEHYRFLGYPADLRVIPDLSYTESRFKILGLRGLVSTLAELILRERKAGRQALINATGGFKAEVAYATLVGLLFDVPVYYIHDAFREIIEMPSIPVSWDYSLIAECEAFLSWLDAELRPTNHVDSRLRDMPSEIRMLLVESEGFTYLSPAGEALFMAYRQQASWNTPIVMSEQAMKSYLSASPALKGAFDRLLSKLGIPHHRASGSGRVVNSDCLVYPRDNRAERLFYFMDGDCVKVCELAEHGGSYEVLLKAGVFARDYTIFVPHRNR